VVKADKDDKLQKAVAEAVVEGPQEARETQQTWDVDAKFSEEQWASLVEWLVKADLMRWQEVAAIMLGELNPPQVGTSLASNKAVQKIYGKGKTWQAVKTWLYAQPGRCAVCGTYLKLEADHIIGKEGGKPVRLENLQLICKRCNAKKRPSHKNAGKTFLTAESALIWLLLYYRPKNYDEFKKICRSYGLTMAQIRFEEAWALAEWLKRSGIYAKLPSLQKPPKP
jgi:hypothetical protein